MTVTTRQRSEPTVWWARAWTRWVLRDDRGDVPGWVLITLMTAGIVTLIWAVAGPMLRDLFVHAINSVTGPN